MKNLKSRVLSILTILVPILMGLAAVYGLLSGKIDHLIPPVPSDLPVIASTYSVDGDVKHRMAEDTIWLPIQIETKFRNGDFIKTGRDSTVEILLDQKEGVLNTVVIAPASFIRIYLVNSKIMIEIHQGQVKTNFEISQSVRFKNGVTEKTVPVPKGETKVNITKDKNSSPTIQLDQETEEETTQTGGGGSGDANGTDLPASNNTPEPENLKQPSAEFLDKKRALTYNTYPMPGTYLFYKKRQDLKLLPKSMCLTNCQLIVKFMNRQIINKEFAKGAVKSVVISQQVYQSENQGEFTWEFSDESGGEKDQPIHFKGNFWVFPYTDKNFSDALKAGAPVEFID